MPFLTPQQDKAIEGGLLILFALSVIGALTVAAGFLFGLWWVIHHVVIH